MSIKVLNGVTLKWCCFNKLDNYGKYGCELILTPEQAATINTFGLKSKPKNNNDGELSFRVRRSEEEGPIEVVDRNKDKITTSIANGAIANVMLDVYPYKHFGGGIACRLKKVQVITWEPYGDDVDFDVVTDESESPF